jgi:hypothetical protein
MRAFSVGKILLGIFVVLLIGATVWACTYRRETRARAVAFSWMRAQNIQQWQTFVESGWSVPWNGRQLRSYRAYYGTEDQKVGTQQVCETKNNRRVCEDKDIIEPVSVYKTRYDYEIERWVTVRTPTREGNDQNPISPDVSDMRPAHDPPQVGDEKLGMPITRYRVVLKNEQRTYTLDITESRWRLLEEGGTYTVIVDLIGREMDIKEHRNA